MAELTARQQLLYVGLVSNADDDGRLKGTLTSLRLTFPTIYNRCADEEIETDLVSVLREMRKLIAYEVDGRRYLVFVNYRKWQRIDKPYKSVLPPPDEQTMSVIASFDERSSNGSGMVAERSTRIKRKELIPPVVPHGDTDEGSVTAEARETTSGPLPAQRTAPRRKPETPTPDAFPLSDTQLAYAEEHGLDPAQAEFETQQFLAHHRAKDSRMRDWEAAWQGWIRNAQRFAPRPRTGITAFPARVTQADLNRGGTGKVVF